MSRKSKVQLEDYEPTTEIGIKAKEQLLRLLNQKYPMKLPVRCCPYTEEQIIEMWQHSKRTEQMRNEKEMLTYEVKIQNQKANA